MGLKIQTNGPQKAQPNAILEKVFTAITKVVHVFIFFLSLSFSYSLITELHLDSTQMRRGWRVSPSSSTGMCGPSSAGSDNDATKKSPALSPDSVRACKTNYNQDIPHLAARHVSSARFFFSVNIRVCALVLNFWSQLL